MYPGARFRRAISHRQISRRTRCNQTRQTFVDSYYSSVFCVVDFGDRYRYNRVAFFSDAPSASFNYSKSLLLWPYRSFGRNDSLLFFQHFDSLPRCLNPYYAGVDTAAVRSEVLGCAFSKGHEMLMIEAQKKAAMRTRRYFSRLSGSSQSTYLLEPPAAAVS